jgi:long-subunit acyl-CoA synthetase (AMP-forming)
VREEFTAEKGEVTPTFKVKRNVVYSHYRDIIDDTYES